MKNTNKRIVSHTYVHQRTLFIKNCVSNRTQTKHCIGLLVHGWARGCRSNHNAYQPERREKGK